MQENKEKNKTTGAENVRWDLSSLYSGIDDPQIDADVKTLSVMAADFRTSYKGALPQSLGNAIAGYLDLTMLESKIGLYLFLKQSTDVTDSIVKKKVAEVERMMNEINGEYLTFFDLELVELKDEELAIWYEKNALVKKHRPWIEYVRIFKPHNLSEPVESALTKRAAFSEGAWNEFFDEVEADLSFEFRNEKKTLTEMTHLLSESKDATERAEALSVISNGLKGAFVKYSAQNLYMVTGSLAVEVKERKYENPMSARNKSNRVSDAVVEALHTAVLKTAGPLTKRYYRLKAAHLGQKILRWSDRNAPMPFSDDTLIPFDEAEKIVIAAYESFSPTLAAIV
ncbi:MAG: hypothetical protein WCW78_03470, partial [Candidatus Paceibacterota bacterium]